MKRLAMLLAVLTCGAGCAAKPWDLPDGELFPHSDILKDPVKVREVVGEDLLILEDGRQVKLANKVRRLAAAVEGSGNEVELPSDDGVIIRKHIIVCGVGIPYPDEWYRKRIGSARP